MIKFLFQIFSAILFVSYSFYSFAIESFKIVIKNNHFEPNTLIIPANQKILLTIDNQDEEAEEFESFDLRREKIIPGKTESIIKIGPLEPGEYSFIGEFHSETAKGKIIAK